MTKHPIRAFQWTGDLAAFGHWFGEFMPINAYEQISVPTDDKRTRYLRVSHGEWIVHHDGQNYRMESPLFCAFFEAVDTPLAESSAS